MMDNVSTTSDKSNSSLTYEDYLKLATDPQSTVVLELDPNGIIQYISKQWLKIVSFKGNGNSHELPIWKPIKDLIKGDLNDKLVFERAMELMLQNDNISYTVTFTTLDDLIFEASGILILTDNKVPSHTMWIIKPFVDINPLGTANSNLTNQFYQINDPQFWKKLGYGATYLNDYLNEIVNSNIVNEVDLPSPRLELCRVCECFVPDWWLELHCQTCIVEHRIESIIQLLHDNLVDQLNLLTKLIDNNNDSNNDNNITTTTTTTTTTNTTSTTITTTSDNNNQNILLEHFTYKGLPLEYKSTSHVINIIYSLIQLCQWAININTSELILKYHKFNSNRTNSGITKNTTNHDHLMSFLKQNRDDHNNNETPQESQENTGWSFEFSPNTKSNIKRIQLWKNPLNNIDNQEVLQLDINTNGLSLLINDTIQLAKEKVDAVVRLDNTMTYSWTIKNEINNDILKVINNQLEINSYELLNTKKELFSTKLDDLDSTRGIDNTDDEKLPKLESPQPSKRKFFADSYLQNNEIPSLSTQPEVNKKINSNNNNLSNLSVPNSESLVPDIIAPKPISQKSSRSVTPSTQLDFEKNTNNIIVHPTIRQEDDSIIVGDMSIKNDRSDAVGSVVSNSDLKIETSNSNILKTADLNNDNSTANISVPLQRIRNRISEPVIYSSNNMEKSENNNNALYPKAFSTISLTPRRGSPLLIQRPNSIKAPLLLSEKSPLNSPFITGREFLTPEQYPNILNSPNQPLSPLLLATNHFKSPIPSIKDYDILKPISKGAYGSVYLARKKLTGEYFAIKVLKKSDMITKNQVTNIKSERAIMMVQSEKSYVAKLFATFQNKEHLFLVMEYLPGGDLAALIKMMDYLPDKWCRQYLSEIVCSVDDMHQEGIIHHDLKPDNLLIDSKGHIKLIDFGLSRAGLVKRHKVIYASDKPSSIISSNLSTPESISSSNTIPYRARKLSNSKQHMDSIDSSRQTPRSTSIIDPIYSIGNDIHSLKRTESQLSFSMIDVSRSSTPPPPTLLNSQIATASTTSARTVTGGSHIDSSISTSGNVLIGNTSSEMENQTLSHNISTPERPRIGSIDSQELRITTVNSTASKININSTNNSVSAAMSDLALFHPGNPKKNKRFFGTPDYLAPETIQGTGEDENCDWWSVGCIFFELLLGYPPFHASTPEKVFEKILTCDIQWPEFSSIEEEKEVISPEAKDLILKLLVLDPKKRLGSKGVEEIKNHPYLKDVDWKNVYEEEASFVPNIDNPEDTDYFDSRGVAFQDFDDDSPKHNEEHRFEVENTSSLNQGTSISNSNSDIPEIQTSMIPNPSLQTDISSTPSSVKWKSLSSSSPSYKEREGTRDMVDKPMNKLSISSVLESLSTDISTGPRNSTKSLSLAIPAHMRERRVSKLSESQTEFGSFSFRNLSALDKANKDAINRLKNEHMNEFSGHRRRSSGSQAGSSSDNSFGKARTSRLSINGSPAINSITKNIKSDNSSIRSCSPDRSISLDQSITSRKGSNASVLESSMNINPLITNATNLHSNNSLYFSDTESPIAAKFKSPLSPSYAALPQKTRSLQISSTKQRRSSSETGSETDDRLNAVSRVNFLRYRRRSQRRSGNTNQEIGYQLDILLCEPIPIHRYRATKDLESLGCTVVSCGAGDELVSRATSGVKFDLIITTLRLKKLGSIDIVKLLRRTYGINSNTPVIAITNYYQEAYNSQAFDEVVEKPVDIEDLRRIIAKYALKKSQEEEDTIFSDNDDFHLT